MTAIDAMVATATLLEVAEPEEMEAERNVSFEDPTSPALSRRSGHGSKTVQVFLELHRDLVSQTSTLLQRQQDILSILEDPESDEELMMSMLSRFAKQIRENEATSPKLPPPKRDVVGDAGNSPKVPERDSVRSSTLSMAEMRPDFLLQRQRTHRNRRESGLAGTTLETLRDGYEAERNTEEVLKKLLAPPEGEEDDDEDTTIIQKKLELMLELGGTDNSLCDKILRPHEEIIEKVFNGWKDQVHGDRDKSGDVEIKMVGRKFFPLHPNGVVRICLDLFGMLVIAYDMVAIPVYLAFSQPPGHIIEEHPFIGALIRFFWSFECFMSFNTAYYNSMAILVEDRTKCVIHHLRTWFIVDLLTVGVDWLKIALDLFYLSEGGLASGTRNSMEAAQMLRMMRLARIIRILRLLRILKLKKLVHSVYDRILGYVEWVQLLLQILQMLVMVLILIHSVGCMWYGFSVQMMGLHEMTWVEYYLFGKEGMHTVDAFDDSVMYHYFTALHWALAQVSPGNIDIMPMNWQERVMNIFVLCLTLIIFSSFISSMTVAVTRLRNIHATDEKKFAILRKYLKSHKIPHDLAYRIHSFLEARRAALAGRTQEKEVELLSQLSKGFVAEISSKKREPTLRSYPVFRHLPSSSEPANDFISMICAEACTEQIFGPSEKVYVVDATSKGMYFLSAGEFELREYRDDDVQMYKIKSRKRKVVIDGIVPEDAWKPENPLPTYVVAWLSEFSLFHPRTHDTMLIARAYCETLQVSRNAFVTLIRQFPILESLLKEYNQKRFEHAMALMGADAEVGDWIRVRFNHPQQPVMTPIVPETEFFTPARKRDGELLRPSNTVDDETLLRPAPEELLRP